MIKGYLKVFFMLLFFSFSLISCDKDTSDKASAIEQIELLEEKEIMLNEKSDYLKEKQDELDNRKTKLDNRKAELEKSVLEDVTLEANNNSVTTADNAESNNIASENDGKEIFYENGYPIYYAEDGTMFDAKTDDIVTANHPMFDEENLQDALSWISDIYEPGMSKEEIKDFLYWSTETPERLINKAVDIYWTENIE